MNDAQADALSLVRTRIHRIEGMVEREVTVSEEGRAVVDFELLFPSSPTIYAPEQRRDGLRRSTIRTGRRGYVVDFTLRLPPLPSAEHDYAELFICVFRMAEELTGKLHVRHRIRLDTQYTSQDSLWPHILPATRLRGGILSAHEMMEYVAELFHQYCERYEGGV